jgi:hypothetical protein
MTERFKRLDADHLDYQFTIDAPMTFTRSWTVSTPMIKIKGPVLEYACHEGNYALPGILGGARADERKAAANSGGKDSGGKEPAPSLATADMGSAADEQLSEAADVLRGLALVNGRAG